MQGAVELVRGLERNRSTKFRPIFKSRPSSNWIESLPSYPEIRKRLLRGASVPELAEWIQGRRREAVDLPRRTLVARLYSYRRVKIRPIREAILYGDITLKEKLKRMAAITDELNEMGDLYDLQKKRITKFREAEEKLPGLPFRHIDDSIDLALKLLNSSAELKQELGLTPRAPSEVNVQVDARIGAIIESRYGRESLLAVLSDPAKRSRVAGIAEKLLTNPRLQAALRKKMGEENGDQTVSGIEVQPERSGDGPAAGAEEGGGPDDAKNDSEGR